MAHAEVELSQVDGGTKEEPGRARRNQEKLAENRRNFRGTSREGRYRRSQGEPSGARFRSKKTKVVL